MIDKNNVLLNSYQDTEKPNSYGSICGFYKMPKKYYLQ